MPMTEVLATVLLPGSNIGDPENNAAVIVRDTMETVSKQKGCQDIYFGTRADDPCSFHLMVEWETLESHHQFMAQDYYKPFVDHFLSTTNGKIDLIHVDFKPKNSLKAVLSAPITAITRFYFGDGGPPSDYESISKNFFDAVGSGPDGYYGHSIGRSHEDVEHEGTKGKGVVLAAGWDRQDTMQLFHESTVFKENSKNLQHGVRAWNTYEVQFMKFVSGT